MKETIEHIIKAAVNNDFLGMGMPRVVRAETDSPDNFWKGVCFRYDIITGPSVYKHFSLADLIFTTNLLECLVGDGDEYIHCSFEAIANGVCIGIECCDDWLECERRHVSYPYNAGYHKQQLSILPPDQWVKYLRGLI